MGKCQQDGGKRKITDYKTVCIQYEWVHLVGRCVYRGVVYVHICVHFKNLEKCNKLIIMVIWVNKKKME